MYGEEWNGREGPGVVVMAHEGELEERDPLWLKAAKKELGVREIPGREANTRVVEYFKASGHGRIVDDETAWCSAFVNWAMAQAGIRGTMALNARSWLHWGKELKVPKKGAVCVFSRGSSGWQGHVGFWVGESGDKIRILGGNQSDGVTIGSYSKSRLIGMRWPLTSGRSRTMISALVGTGATGASGILEVAEEARGFAESAAVYLDWMKYAMLGIVFVSFALTIYFKWTDIHKTRMNGDVE